MTQLQPANLQHLSHDELRQLVIQQAKALAERDQRIAQHDQLIAQRDASIHQLQTHTDKLTHELALLRRYRFGKRSQ
jgi:uncharacterized protein (DUF3084 family)